LPAEDARKVASSPAPSKPPGTLQAGVAAVAVRPARGVAAAVAVCDELQFSAELFSVVQRWLRKPCTSDGGGDALLSGFTARVTRVSKFWLPEPWYEWLHPPRKDRELLLGTNSAVKASIQLSFS
jgi:hypothetical protein